MNIDRLSVPSSSRVLKRSSEITQLHTQSTRTVDITGGTNGIYYNGFDCFRKNCRGCGIVDKETVFSKGVDLIVRDFFAGFFNASQIESTSLFENPGGAKGNGGAIVN